MDFIKTLDVYNDYYLNIICDDKTNNKPSKFLRNELSYKDGRLLDFDDTLYKRKQKLERINKISKRFEKLFIYTP